MDKYDHQAIEKKWQEKWRADNLYHTGESQAKPKCYVLDMFPYPSGAGLHVGHPKGYIATDVFSRLKMLQGYNILHSMGWDAFGLPAENYAIENKIHPRQAVTKNIQVFKKQLEKIGFNYDWDREINTTDPEYYKWTQWVFLQMFNRGLAYESYEPINWCPSCKTGLANEDLEGGKCERCGSEIERRPMRQWVLKITNYAERLLNDIDKLELWEDSIKEMQRNWIGRSEGALVDFAVAGSDYLLSVFTTRPDTLFGATFMVVAPEHEIISKFKTKISNLPEVEDYIKQARAKSDLERTDLAKEKTGIELKGIQAVNPVNNTEIPIFVADYVLAGYGTGAIMAVPAHDERDWEFAQKFNIPIKFVVAEDVKKTIVVIHGLTGHSRENWFPWLKELLTNCGYKVLIPDLPNSEQPVMTEWHAALDDLRNEIEGELIVVGHSLGAITACKYLESRNLPATKLILVAPTGKSEQAWKGIKVAGFGPEHVKVLNDFDNTEIDWRKLNSLVKEAYVYFSDNDPYIPSSIRDDYRELKATLRIFSGKGHFNESGGVTEFPEILLDILGLFAADGRAVNSEQFNNLSTAEVKEKIISWLEEKKIGRRAVNYKLRDWVFSRQRYWGEPIPVVHCENCQKKIFTQAVTINFYIQSVWERLLSGQKQVETRALNPEEPDRYFGQVKVGSYLRAVNKLTNEEAYFEVTQVWQYKNLAELFADKEVLRKVCAPKQLPDDLAKLEKGYSYAAGYVEKINTNGLMAWEVRRIAPGVVPVPEKDLPVTLPEVENYEPTGTGESPLAAITDWVNTTCPVCGGPAKRETNTMPQWAGSSWYYLRYIDPHNQEALVDQAKEKYWSPVDLYVGGAEHATRHLIYARFWHKFLYDSGVVSYEEPFTRLQHVGLIMAEDGRKMGKRWHNVINPDDVIAQYGADSLRVYEMFMGPFNQSCTWSTNGLKGARGFLDKVEQLKVQPQSNPKEDNLIHKAIKKVGADIESFHFNTAISTMMILVNESVSGLSQENYEKFLILLAPFAPHLAEELWSRLGHQESIFKQSWPEFNPELARDDEFELVIQVNGKVRDKLPVKVGITQSEVEQLVRDSDKVQKYLDGKAPKKVIYVPDKLVNIVI